MTFDRPQDDVTAAMARAEEGAGSAHAMADRAGGTGPPGNARKRRGAAGDPCRHAGRSSTWLPRRAAAGPCSNMTGVAGGPIAAEIGVTASDLSRVSGRAIHRLREGARHLRMGWPDPDRFYRRPAGAPKARKTPRGRQSAVRSAVGASA